MKSNFTREHPESPGKDSVSDWYWFYKDGEDQWIISEVYAERKWFSPGWWGPKVSGKPRKKPK